MFLPRERSFIRHLTEALFYDWYHNVNVCVHMQALLMLCSSVLARERERKKTCISVLALSLSVLYYTHIYFLSCVDKPSLNCLCNLQFFLTRDRPCRFDKHVYLLLRWYIKSAQCGPTCIFLFARSFINLYELYRY